VRLSATTREDAERLAAESLPGLSAAGNHPQQLLLEFDDPARNTPNWEARDAAKSVIDTFIWSINGLGKLRWGRTFEGVALSAVSCVEPNGRVMQVEWGVSTAHDDMLPEEIADMLEARGRPRPELPAWLDVINGLDLAGVTSLAGRNPKVALVLHLIEMMLDGEGEISWVAAASALEAIEHDLQLRQLDGQKLGWWTDNELTRFNGTANNLELLGPRARHGKPFPVPKRRMTTGDASWLVRRVAAHWVTDLLEAEKGES
jgi:hypothetical protein